MPNPFTHVDSKMLLEDHNLTPINYLERLNDTVNNREHMLSQLQSYSKEDHSPIMRGGKAAIDKRLNSSIMKREI